MGYIALLESRLAHAGPSLEEGKVVMILGAPVISTTRTGAPDTLDALGTRVHSLNSTAILKRPACCHPPQTASILQAHRAFNHIPTLPSKLLPRDCNR